MLHSYNTHWWHQNNRKEKRTRSSEPQSIRISSLRTVLYLRVVVHVLNSNQDDDSSYLVRAFTASNAQTKPVEA